jgi:pyruvate/2-oxoglutarate dehydrogenase complex dihydrolipoamide acyltransferase (E2) component
VETAEGREVTLAEYLEKVWEVVGRTALENVLGTAEARARNGVAGALEEDARLTALFLWTLQSTNDAAGTQPAEAADPSDSSDPSDPSDPSDSPSPTDDEAEDAPAPRRTGGYTLVFDVVRRFAQPLGIDLPKWEGRIIETQKGMVRLLPVVERARQLFGDHGAAAAAEWIERHPGRTLQLDLFVESGQEGAVPRRGRTGGKRRPGEPRGLELDQGRQVTTLDRVHAAMLLQKAGQTHALRALLEGERERGPDFLRLANALSALYPRDSEEKRLVNAMLLAVPR